MFSLVCSLLIVSTQASQDNGKEMLLWLDLEMTGISAGSDFIVEATALLTDSNLHIVAEFPRCLIRSRLDAAQKVQQSEYTFFQVENEIIRFLSTHYGSKKIQLWRNDSFLVNQEFLALHMPYLLRLVDDRILDLTLVTEIVQCQLPILDQKFNNALASQEHSNISESIARLKYYKENIVKKKKN